MEIQFKFWDKKNGNRFVDRVYITVDGQDAGYVERAGRAYENSDEYNITIEPALYDDLFDIMDADYTDIIGETEVKDDFYKFNLFKRAAVKPILVSTVHQKNCAKYYNEYANGIEI